MWGNVGDDGGEGMVSEGMDFDGELSSGIGLDGKMPDVAEGATGSFPFMRRVV
jgi:hypothetical protein